MKNIQEIIAFWEWKIGRTRIPDVRHCEIQILFWLFNNYGMKLILTHFTCDTNTLFGENIISIIKCVKKIDDSENSCF